MALHPRLIEQARGPLITEHFSLPLAVSIRGVFFGKIQLHRELTHLALEGSDAGLILGDDAGFGLLVRQLTTVELGQPQLDAVGGDVMAALRIAPPDDARPDILAELQLEWCRMSTVWTS
jgi:hypothetical protein